MMRHGKIKRNIYRRGTGVSMRSIDIREANAPPKSAKVLGRSRVWLQKWIRRYNDSNKSSKTGRFKEESRAPKNVHRKTDSEIEQLVVNVRKSLLGRAQVFASGNVNVWSNTEKKARRLMHRVELFIRRALKCHGCGVCVGKCPNDVIAIDDGVAVIGDGCVHCGKCIEVCPVVKFG